MSYGGLYSAYDISMRPCHTPTLLHAYTSLCFFQHLRLLNVCGMLPIAATLLTSACTSSHVWCNQAHVNCSAGNEMVFPEGLPCVWCRSRHLDALEWILYLNMYGDVLYSIVWGDKDLYRLAFTLAGQAEHFTQVCTPAPPLLHALSSTSNIFICNAYGVHAHVRTSGNDTSGTSLQGIVV